MLTIFTAAFLIPVGLALLFTPWAIELAGKIGAVDKPGGRKIHLSTTPRLGGLAIVCSMILTTILLYLLFPALFEGIGNHLFQVTAVAVSILGIFFLGFRDDIKPLGPGLKFGVQIVIAGLIYFAGFKISNITNPLGGGLVNVEMIDFPLTLIWIVGVTNAFNLIDGLDGLSSGVATIACMPIFVVSALAGQIWPAVLALVIAGALIGFLRYNFSPAKIFLGDCGSLLIGFCLALLSIHSTTKISTGFALLFPMLALGLPITDTLVSMVRRFLAYYMPEKSEGQSKSIVSKLHGMFTPDSSHIHHQLISLGLTHRNSVLVLYFVSGFFALGAFSITQVENLERSVTIMLLFGIALVLGIKKLKYREMAIFNNGMMMSIYEKLVLNHTTFLSLMDLSFIVASYMLSYNMVYSLDSTALEFLIFDQTLMVIIAIQLLTFWLTGLYRKTIRQMGIGNALGITASVGYALINTTFVVLAMGVMPFSSGVQFLILDFYFLLTFTLGLRIAYQALSYWFNRGKKSGRNVLIYGANENGTMILHKINKSMQNSFKVLGFLDDDSSLEGKMIYGYPILGGHWKLGRILQEKDVNCIFICEDSIKPENFRRLQRLAGEKEVEIKHLQVRLKDIEQAAVNGEQAETALSEPTISYG